MSKLSDILKGLAPNIALAVGSVAGGPAAGIALSTLAKSLLNKDAATEEELVTVLAQPNAVQTEQLKALDNHFKLEMERLALEPAKIAAADRSDARSMQKVALAQEDVFSKRFSYYFATGWSAFSMVYVAAITFVDIPKENVSFANFTLGFLLGTAIASIFNFLYGSSSSEKSKDRRASDKVNDK